MCIVQNNKPSSDSATITLGGILYGAHEMNTAENDYLISLQLPHLQMKLWQSRLVPLVSE